MNIRPYTASDYTDIIELFRLNTPDYFSLDEEEGLSDYLNNHIHKHYIADDNGIIMGCGGFAISKDGKTASLAWDIVHPASHGKGLGTILTNYRINEIKMISNVEVLSVRTSQVAYKFYQKFGFILKNSIKDYWAKGFDLYDMECSINNIITVSR